MLHSLVVQDEWNRFYFAFTGKPAEYNTYDRLISGAHNWTSGVPASSCPPGVVSGGGDTMQVGNAIQRLEDAGVTDYRTGNGIFLTLTLTG